MTPGEGTLKERDVVRIPLLPIKCHRVYVVPVHQHRRKKSYFYSLVRTRQKNFDCDEGTLSMLRPTY